MALAQKLVMRQSQSLVMTPQLSQSIKLLALSNIDLSAFVSEELERNPFLEREVVKDGLPMENRTPEFENPAEKPEAIRDLTSNTELETSAQSLAENLGTSLENVYPDEQDYVSADAPKKEDRSPADNYRMSSTGLSVSSSASAHDRSVADFSADTETLRDQLMSQLSMANISPAINLISADIIQNLDDAGYFSSDLEKLAERLGATTEDAESALALVQSFEPIGVGARSLKECLSLQLQDKDRLDPAMQAIINNLELLAKRDFASLSKICGLEIDELHDALGEIQSLDPKPGTAFENGPIQHVAPDVFVTEANDGSWKIELNSQTLPRVLINQVYVTEVSGKLEKNNDKEFMTECLQTANWLTKSLDQRARTIMKVSREIVKKQDAFLIHGVQHLKPLTLREIADEIDMHESSVSRVTSNKYMMTPRGLFELKYFFTTAIANNSGGEGHSSEAVRDRIKTLVDAESPDAVLSDDAIVTTLKSFGIDIARRTIAKYRDSMHIPSSVQRRREKRAAMAAIS
ncbi:MAG: RNA polymerase sigma-54 factor [Hyphomicrobiales bacterium]|nr:MAG: RNA polymerase sigma-54 factor [Hyphomicrobiales bacterium]